jgi:multidrug efflux system membrane fusion protein
LVSIPLTVMVGCHGQSNQIAPSQAPVLPVSKPLQKEVTDYVDFTGRTVAVEAVDIRPRVTGYLVKMPFKEGSEVKKDELLFEIDPRPYTAQLDQAEGQVKLNEASLKLAKTTYERDRAISTSVAGGVSQQQLDQDLAAVDEADARLRAAKASTEVYRLNLGFTKVTSPIDGMISRYYYTRGNLVNQDQTLLTTIVSLDPMHVYFDMDEPTLLRLRKARNAGLIKPNPNGLFPVLMGLQGEDGFPHPGTVDFVNNQVNPATGSLTLRGVFLNPKPAGGTRLLSPGMFVRIRLPIGSPHPALLVIDRAIGSDQGLRYVYVVDDEDKIQYRRVTTGALQENGLRVISQGLEADDRVLVGGLQQVRPNMLIEPEPRDMPTLDQAAPTAAPDAPSADSKESQGTSGTSSK